MDALGRFTNIRPTEATPRHDHQGVNPTHAKCHTDRGTNMAVSMEKITIEPGKRGGKPCVRGLRITVWDILGWLGAGMTEAQILDEHPDLEKDDFPAVYQFAAEAGRRTKIG